MFTLVILDQTHLVNHLEPVVCRSVVPGIIASMGVIYVPLAWESFGDGPKMSIFYCYPRPHGRSGNVYCMYVFVLTVVYFNP